MFLDKIREWDVFVCFEDKTVTEAFVG